MARKLDFIINHVFLPPELPQTDDHSIEEEKFLVQDLFSALESFQSYISPPEQLQWKSCKAMVANIIRLGFGSKSFPAEKVEASLKDMEHGEFIALHIRAQNAGLIIRRISDQYIVESFEISATDEAVMATKGRLIRCFPGPAMTIKQNIIQEDSSVQPLLKMLGQLHVETPREAFSTTIKAGSEVIEVRDTVNPRFVTEMVMAILRAVGQPLEVPRIYKHTRDDVAITSGLKPWRRSSFWLFLRVVLQTSLACHKEKDQHQQYKSFMVFFMTTILESALEISLPSQTIFIMTAKISRRVLKLKKKDESLWLHYIEQVIKKAQIELVRRWSKIEKDPDPFNTQKNWRPSDLSFVEDTILTLPRLRPYLAKVLGRSALPPITNTFTANCSARIPLRNSVFPQEPPSTSSENEDRLHLADIELWVHDHLNDWLKMKIGHKYTCTTLANFIKAYTTTASSKYSGSPEEISLMILTIMDLWVALDKCAIHHYPLLKEYKPDFQRKVFDPLLLPRRSQMERLLYIEQYLEKRTTEATSYLPSVFHSDPDKNCLGVRYFQQSSHLQNLKRKIEDEANDERAQKRAELIRKSQKYKGLTNQAARMVCETYTVREYYGNRTYCKPDCEKCRIENEAESMEISVHEWPLPANGIQAKCAMFELCIPTVIFKWRNTTYHILAEVLSANTSRRIYQSNVYSLHDYGALIKFNQPEKGRITFVSEKKSFKVAHYRSQKVSAAHDAGICVPNGLWYGLFDSTNGGYTTNFSTHQNIRSECSFKLPAGPYEGLQYAVENTVHTNNYVLSCQAKCHETLTLQEFGAFGTLRSHNRLQWRNIARELTTRILNFGRLETLLLFIQASWQAGPSGSRFIRESHVDLQENEFGLHLLSALNEATGTIEGNWQGVIAARTFVLLATRLLSVSTSNEIREGCIAFLRRLRCITLNWTHDLEQKFQQCQSEDEMKDINIRTLETALTCHGTYNVDLRDLQDSSGLLLSDQDIAVLIECSIIIHDRCPTVLNDLPKNLVLLFRRQQRLSHMLEGTMRDRILKHPVSLDTTISRFWEGYVPGNGWNSLDKPNNRWQITEIPGETGTSHTTVHFNILDGSLLINGSSLTRLPATYESHQTYRRLFGTKLLKVVPSSMSGMLYETRAGFINSQVYFGMYEEELIIRIKKEGQLYEIIPAHAMEGDFPQSFIDDYTHWLRIENKTIEWLPLKDAWGQSKSDWQMQTDDLGIYRLRRPSMTLIDIHKATAKAISLILSPLELPQHIHITIKDMELLEVHLPRLKLDFFLKKDAKYLESKQFRGMIVDANQSFGSFTGLVNKLVLKDINASAQSVIIPYGRVKFISKQNHVSIFIANTSNRVPYHTFHIDSQLGRLVDNGSLTSKLFRCYLHAITANCLVDELTGRTGTEEALSILKSYTTRSFLRLEQTDIQLLQLLADLTPTYRYYPKHLAVMQEIEWNELPSLSQHKSYRELVGSIFRHARDLGIFHDQPVSLPNVYGDGHQFLIERSAIRDSTFRLHGFGAEDHTNEHDKPYKSREHQDTNTEELQVYSIAKMVNTWSTNLQVCSELLQELQDLNKSIEGYGQTADFSLTYDTRWLEPLETFLPNLWCTIQVVLSESLATRDKYKIMVFLSTLMYSQNAKVKIVNTMLAFATVPGLRHIRPPDYELFQLSYGFDLTKNLLSSSIAKCTRPYEFCPEAHLLSRPYETPEETDNRRREEHRIAKNRCINILVEHFISQWPKKDPFMTTNNKLSSHINVDKAVRAAREYYQICYQNLMFEHYITKIQSILNNISENRYDTLPYKISLPDYCYNPPSTYISFNDIIKRAAPEVPNVELENLSDRVINQIGQKENHEKLGSLLARLHRKSSQGHEQKYAFDLQESFNAFGNITDYILDGSIESLKPLLCDSIRRCQNHVEKLVERIRECLQEESSILRRISVAAGMWPRLSAISLLEKLGADRSQSLPGNWKHCLVEYGLAISSLQRVMRLKLSVGNNLDLLNELRNPGHKGWDPMDHPQWLLLEIENNILIREEQAQIAHEMINPSSRTNSIMQLNMGEGKSSVIVPIVAATLADKRKLVRVVVLRALSTQMFNVLVKKFSRMLGIPIFHMPISRSIRLNVHEANRIRFMCEDCLEAGGIILIQPEHILSFGLMGLDRLLTGDSELGLNLISTQRWLEANSRDILDESDEILNVRFELIYTMGSQRQIELGPDRWTIIQQILGLIRQFSSEVTRLSPKEFELGQCGSGRFPRFRILQQHAGNRLLTKIATEVCSRGLAGLPVWSFSPKVRDSLSRFLTDIQVSKSDIDLLRERAFSAPSTKGIILLLRGLFAGGIIQFALGQKRWRVDYGHDFSRTMLAVPYRAKDSPAARAEFSHPDSTMVLTCLSYYYQGLSDDQLLTAFERLLREDSALEEYESWIKDVHELPEKFRQLTGINLSDSAQCFENVFPHLRFSKKAIDFYTSQIVFPKEMKEFQYKLSSSSWDIAQKKVHPTTGFSGTNDSKYILPLSIDQCDLPQQRHTNARVIDYLLRPENSFESIMERSGGQAFDAESLIKAVTEANPPVRVILDVGAQVLELKNEEVAKRWLSCISAESAQAVVFFNDHDNLSVMDRDGTVEPLMISPFTKQMDQCLVYLDEVHTRGTDLILPIDYRAAVTLGPGLTKDRLVQACMRLRKLGKGQSVMFCAPPEIERKILKFNGKELDGVIEVSDVLEWSISETCIAIRKCVPLWATQGMRHLRRDIAWLESPANEDFGIDVAKTLLEDEAQSLETRYGPGESQTAERIVLRNEEDISLEKRKSEVKAIRQKCQDFKLESFSSAILQEEQERELSPENEKEIQTERPLSLEPHQHNLHPDVRDLILGYFKPSSDAFQPAFHLFRQTSAGKHFESESWPKSLLMTSDFARTVQVSGGQLLDEFLRPVNWIVSLSTDESVKYVILSPYEVHELLPEIRRHKKVILHVYASRVNTSICTFDDLTFCAIPPLENPTISPAIIRQLNLFAGQIYLKDYKEYLAICRFLGLCFKAAPPGVIVASDGFVQRSDRAKVDTAMAHMSPFNTSPVEFLRIIMALRTKGQSFEKSHVGRMVHMNLLKKEDFQ